MWYALRIKKAIDLSLLGEERLYIPHKVAGVGTELVEGCNCTICTCWIFCNSRDHILDWLGSHDRFSVVMYNHPLLYRGITRHQRGRGWSNAAVGGHLGRLLLGASDSNWGALEQGGFQSEYVFGTVGSIKYVFEMKGNSRRSWSDGVSGIEVSLVDVIGETLGCLDPRHHPNEGQILITTVILLDLLLCMEHNKYSRIFSLC